MLSYHNMEDIVTSCLLRCLVTFGQEDTCIVRINCTNLKSLILIIIFLYIILRNSWPNNDFYLSVVDVSPSILGPSIFINYINTQIFTPYLEENGLGWDPTFEYDLVNEKKTPKTIGTQYTYSKHVFFGSHKCYNKTFFVVIGKNKLSRWTWNKNSLFTKYSDRDGNWCNRNKRLLAAIPIIVIQYHKLTGCLSTRILRLATHMSYICECIQTRFL